MASPWVVERYGSKASAAGLSNKSAALGSDMEADAKSTYCPRFYARADANSHAHMYTQTQLCSVATGVMGPCELHRECALWLPHLSSSIYMSRLYAEHTQNTLGCATVMNVVGFCLFFCRNIHLYVRCKCTTHTRGASAQVLLASR